MCNGSHGISVGSLGQYANTTDIVENIFVSNISMSNASNRARIKVFGGNPDPLSSAGGGTGYVKNVTYSDFRVTNVDNPIFITQCYNTPAVTCAQYPSKLSISDVHCESEARRDMRYSHQFACQLSTCGEAPLAARVQEWLTWSALKPAIMSQPRAQSWSVLRGQPLITARKWQVLANWTSLVPGGRRFTSTYRVVIMHMALSSLIPSSTLSCVWESL